jgi:hypothetical protein
MKKIPTLVQQSIEKERQFVIEQYYNSQSNILKEFEIIPKEYLSLNDMNEIKFKNQIESLIRDIFHGKTFSDEFFRKPEQSRRKTTLCLYYEGDNQMIDTYNQSLEDYFLLRGFKFVDNYAFLFDAFNFIGENTLFNEFKLKGKKIVLPTPTTFQRPGELGQTYLGIDLISSSSDVKLYSEITFVNTDRINDECHDARSQHRRFQSCWKSDFCFILEKIL